VGQVQSTDSCKSTEMETTQQNFTTTAKGRDFLYAHDDQLYFCVKTEGSMKYLKCIAAGSKGSAKLVGNRVTLGVCIITRYG